MSQRPRRLYWISRPGKKDLMVFDGGYMNGEIHVYEKKETHSVKEIEETIPPEYANEAVSRWIEQHLGRAISWEISELVQ